MILVDSQPEQFFFYYKNKILFLLLAKGESEPLVDEFKMIDLQHHLQYANHTVNLINVQEGLTAWSILEEENEGLLETIGAWLHNVLGDVTRDIFRGLPSITAQISGN